jgi:hypothetical protein
VKIVVGKWKGQKQMKMKQYKKNDSCDFFPQSSFYGRGTFNRNYGKKIGV